MESFRPTAPGAGAAGSCGCGTRCPALIGGSCRCGCACLLDSRDARRLLAEQLERDQRQAVAKNQYHPLKDDDAAAAARALTALSGLPRQQEHAVALQAASKKKGGSCCGGNAGGGAQPHQQQPAAASAGCGGNADVRILEHEEDSCDAELEGIAAIVAAAVGAPLAGECFELSVLAHWGCGSWGRRVRVRERRKEMDPNFPFVSALPRALGSTFPSFGRLCRCGTLTHFFVLFLLSLSLLSLSLSLSRSKQSSSPLTRRRASRAGHGVLAGGGRGSPPRWSEPAAGTWVPPCALPLRRPRPPPLRLRRRRRPQPTTMRSGKPALLSARRSSRGSLQPPW